MERDESRPKHARVTEDCFAQIVRDFLASPKFAGYADATKDLWARYLNFAARPNCLGAISVQEIRPALVQAFLKDHDDGQPWQHIICVQVIERHLAEHMKGKGDRTRALAAIEHAAQVFVRTTG